MSETTTKSSDSKFAVPSNPFRAKTSKFGLMAPKPEQPIEDEDEEEPHPISSDEKVSLLYEPPFWSGKPKLKYQLELLKDGVSKGSIDFFLKGFYLFGRAPICDIILDHPTISRQHAVIQFRRNGDAFLYDLGSVHGTFLGKNRIKPNSYIPIPKNNNLIKFGSSTRFYVLHLPEEKNNDSDDEEEEEIEKTENPNTNKQISGASIKNKLRKEREREKRKQSKTARMIEEFDETDEDFAKLTEHNEFFKSMYAKDDYDAFFDRTGRIEKRNEMKRKSPNQVETYETLVAKQKIILSQIKALEDDIAQLEKTASDSEQNAESDDLDSFMVQLSITLQREKIGRKKKLLVEFKGDYERLFSLGKLVKPALSGLSDISNFTEYQLKLLSQFEQELKKKKSDTDNDTRDRSAEKKQQIHQQMTNMAKTSRTKTGLPPKSDTDDPQNPTSSSSPPSSPNSTEDSRSFNVPLPSDLKDSAIPTYQPSLLSGVAEAIEKQKKAELLKERELTTEDEDEDKDPSTKNKKKKKKKTNFDQDHQNYDNFEPPEGQTGDGRTYLNEKFGY